MKIERRDVYSFLIAVLVVTITSIIQIENPIPDNTEPSVANISMNLDNLALLKQE